MPKILPSFRLLLEPIDEQAAKLQPFQWASDGIGQRHKLGGTPDFLEQSDYPVCSCGSTMSFYGQLDSLNDEFNLADCGVISVFVCFDCFEISALLSTT